MGGRCDNKKRDLTERVHPLGILGYKTGNDITECDITEVKVFRVHH